MRNVPLLARRVPTNNFIFFVVQTFSNSTEQQYFLKRQTVS